MQQLTTEKFGTKQSLDKNVILYYQLIDLGFVRNDNPEHHTDERFFDQHGFCDFILTRELGNNTFAEWEPINRHVKVYKNITCSFENELTFKNIIDFEYFLSYLD